MIETARERKGGTQREAEQRPRDGERPAGGEHKGGKQIEKTGARKRKRDTGEVNKNEKGLEMVTRAGDTNTMVTCAGYA